MWINERLTRAKVPNYGNSLLSVQMLLGKNRTLRNEVDSHEPTVISVVDLGLSMIEEGHPQSDDFQQHINELNSLWSDLQSAVDQQKARIELSEIAQQVLNMCASSASNFFLILVMLYSLRCLDTIGWASGNTVTKGFLISHVWDLPESWHYLS